MRTNGIRQRNYRFKEKICYLKINTTEFKDIETKDNQLEGIKAKAENMDATIETDCNHAHEGTIYIKEEYVDVKIEPVDLKEEIMSTSLYLPVDMADVKEEAMGGEYDHIDPINIKCERVKDELYEAEVKYKLIKDILDEENNSDNSKTTKQHKSVYSNLSLEIFNKSIIGKRVDIPHGCNQCEFKTDVKQELKLHIKARHKNSSGMDVYACDQCDFKSKNKSNLDVHVKVHNIYNCNHCEFQTKWKNNLKSHIKWKHINNIKKNILYRCYLCDCSAIEKEDLKIHIETVHEKLSYPSTQESSLKTNRKNIDKNVSNSDDQCDYINHAFADHKQNHTGEKPYMCDVCPQTFTSKSIYEQHKLIHTGEKPFQCDKCEKSFRLATGMRKHKRRIHGVW